MSSSGTFRIVTGTIYGSDAAEGLKNTAIGGAALNRNPSRYGTAQRGTFSGTDGAWVSKGDIPSGNYTNDMINVENGELVP